jgi:hypothetical protein
MKHCSGCNKNKHRSAFGKNRSRSDGLNVYCKLCTNKKNRTWGEAHPEILFKRSQKANLKHEYGITPEVLQVMLDKQDHKCLICGRELELRGRGKSPTVDHDHNTGKIRGVLCWTCNVGLGNFKDSPQNVLSAFQYLTITSFTA